jgi:hypothetical protein
MEYSNPKVEKVFSLSFAIWIQSAPLKSLELFSEVYPEDLHIIQVDNAPFTPVFSYIFPTILFDYSNPLLFHKLI